MDEQGLTVDLAGVHVEIDDRGTIEACQQAIFQHGVCKLRGANVFSSEYGDALRQAIDEACERTLAKLNERQINFKSQVEPFRFKEVSSRCPGRLDLRVDCATAPWSSSELLSNPKLSSIAAALLSQDYKLNYTGVVVSLPGSEDQEWHMDGNHLFPHAQLPPHALTVFLPLDDLEEAQGSPQVCTCVHVRERESMCVFVCVFAGSVPCRQPK
eukprot:m.128549 g.128549  ORF g.128549 m.128549 type:complete len:213 (-) comp13873_c1_seq1:2195-2833(-)